MTFTDRPLSRLPSPSTRYRAIDVLGAFSLAGDLSLGLSAGHGVRATYLGMRLADALGLPEAQRSDLFYAELLMDAGCTAWNSQIAAMILGDEIAARRQLLFFSDPRDPRDILRWLARYMAAGERLGTRLRRAANFAVHGRAFMVEGLQNSAEVAACLAGRLGRSAAVQDALRFAFEEWDGSGPHGRRAQSIPLLARIVYTTIFLEVFHQVEGRAAAIRLARARRGRALDPAVVDAFMELARDEGFWGGLETEDIWARVSEMEPDSAYQYVDASRVDDVAVAFADFADLKSFYTAGHSRRVAALAESMARALAVHAEDVAAFRQAGLLHDVGLVAVPSFVLHKAEDRLTAADWESLRLHPYHADRILGRVAAFAAALPLVAAHHEQPDGRGYHRGLSGGQVPLGARLIAVADRFDELTHARPERAALSADAAVSEIRRDVGTRFFGEAFEALLHVLHHPAPGAAPQSAPCRPPRSTWPAGLTDREVEVLRVLATGANRRVMGERLSVSEHTIRHHLEHIYAKIDARTRVEATLFALEHDLLR